MTFNSSTFRFLVLITSILTLNPQHSLAATIEVDIAADNSNLSSLHNNGTCSLREAIQNANSNNNAYTDCEAGAGADVITFNGVSSITLVDDISVISDIQIQGTVTLSGGNITRIFTVGSAGILRLVDVTLQNGKDASGGAILQNAVSSTIECSGSTFKNNKADSNGGAINSRDKKLFKSLQKSGFNSALLLASGIPANSTNCS